MPAYIIAQIEVTDPAAFETYRRLVPATIEAHGGRYLVRGGEQETLEGNWQPKRVVVIEFPSRAQAKAWWSSRAYEPVKAIRQASARTELIAIDGL